MKQTKKKCPIHSRIHPFHLFLALFHFCPFSFALSLLLFLFRSFSSTLSLSLFLSHSSSLISHPYPFSLFERSPGCDLLTCKRCGSYLNYNQFPIRFNGNANLATYEKIAQREVELAEATHVKAVNPELHKLMTTLVRSRVNIEDKKVGRVGEDGDVVPADVDIKKLPDHLIGCPYDVLYAAMTMKTCMQWIGSHTFDDCMWDACALASKDGGLTASEAVLKATEINIGKEKAKLAAKESEEAMKVNLEKAEKRDEAGAE
jgi:hypothetical protein